MAKMIVVWLRTRIADCGTATTTLVGSAHAGAQSGRSSMLPARPRFAPTTVTLMGAPASVMPEDEIRSAVVESSLAYEGDLKRLLASLRTDNDALEGLILDKLGERREDHRQDQGGRET
jgi:hypothetical protein